MMVLFWNIIKKLIKALNDMRKFFLTLVSILVCSSLAFCSNIEETYIFDVGQGNCQFFRYGNVGILYDGGSSTSRTFSKIKPLKGETLEYFITRKIDKINKIYSTNTKEEDIKNDTKISQNFFNKFKNISEFSHQKKVGKGKKEKLVKNVSEQEKEDDIERLIDVLGNSNLEYLVLFLSHPDQDHINYIKDIISDEKFEKLILLSFLGGDWFNHDTEDSIELINFLNKRNQTTTFYPYYFEFEQEDYPQNYGNLTQTYIKLTDKFQENTLYYENELREIKEFNLELEEEKNAIINLKNKYGIEHRSDFMKNMKESHKFPTLNQGSYTHSTPFFGTLFDVGQKMGLNYLPKELVNVYIWSLNHYADDVNEQSIVISCTLPSLGMNFFCTGDAGESTFNHIDVCHNLMKLNLNYNIKTNPIYFYSDFTNIVVLPHHGSKNNQSLTMLKLFNPHILISSAGYGLHNHPDINVHDFYRKKLTSAFQKLTKEFLIEKAEDEIIFFDDKGEKAYLKRYEYGYPLMLGTNLCGDIKFDTQGIARQYNPYLVSMYGKYRPNISVSIYSCPKEEEEQLNIQNTDNKNLIFSNDTNEILYYISDKTTSWFYSVEKIN